MSLVRNKYMALFCALGASVYSIGCGDSDSPPDARIPTEFDAATGPDGAPPDGGADPDAATPAAFEGAISLMEVKVNGAPAFGEGLQASIEFTPVTAPDLVVGTQANGCVASELTAEEAAALSSDEGTVEFTVADGSPVMPACNFVAGSGYRCISAQGQGMLVIVDDAGGANTASVTVTSNPAAAFSAADVGRYLNIVAASPSGNTGAFPIVAAPSATTVIIANPGAASATFAGGYAVVAGVGPAPGVSDPFENDDDVTVKFTPKTGSPFAAFEIPFGAGGVGDEFELTTASATLLSAIPTDGTEFTIGCDPAMGCAAGTATGQILVINTTDTTPSASPVDFPNPTTKGVSIRCTRIGGNAITVPATVSEFIKNSNAKRIQAIFLRVNLKTAGTTGKTVNIVTGHGIVGFTTPAAP